MAHAEGSAERLAAIQEAALAPKLFKQIYQTHREASDATLSAHLITNLSFGDDGAKRAIKSFRETIKLAGLDRADSGEADVRNEPDQEAGGDVQRPLPVHSSSSRLELARVLASKAAADLAVLGVPVPDSGKVLRFSIARDSEAQITFSGPITQEAIEKLAALLELQKDTFPTKV